MAWTQAICDHCWRKQHPNREPQKIRREYRQVERCAFCDKKTASGIYVRHDPAKVPFPAKN